MYFFKGENLLSIGKCRPSLETLLTISRINQYDLIIIKWLFNVLPFKVLEFCIMLNELFEKLELNCTVLVDLTLFSLTAGGTGKTYFPSQR